jgi:hypothetical protein
VGRRLPRDDSLLQIDDDERNHVTRKCPFLGRRNGLSALECAG